MPETGWGDVRVRRTFQAKKQRFLPQRANKWWVTIRVHAISSFQVHRNLQSQAQDEKNLPEFQEV